MNTSIPSPFPVPLSSGQVARTGKGGFIPVYRDIKNGRTRVITIVKKASGDLDVRSNVFAREVAAATRA